LVSPCGVHVVQVRAEQNARNGTWFRAEQLSSNFLISQLKLSVAVVEAATALAAFPTNARRELHVAAPFAALAPPTVSRGCCKRPVISIRGLIFVVFVDVQRGLVIRFNRVLTGHFPHTAVLPGLCSRVVDVEYFNTRHLFVWPTWGLEATLDLLSLVTGVMGNRPVEVVEVVSFTSFLVQGVVEAGNAARSWLWPPALAAVAGRWLRVAFGVGERCSEK